jgi:DNA replication licensing factor MCM4
MTQKFASEEDVYSRLVESFAPSIWEMDDIKRGILCQLFGGTIHSDVQVRRHMCIL